MDTSRYGVRLGGWMLAAALLLPSVGRSDLIEDQFNFATGLLIREEFELAAEEFAAMLERHPAMPQADIALFRLGESYWRLERGADARAAFESLLERFPQSELLPRALYRLGQLLDAEDPARAAAAYARLARDWPDHSLAEAALYWSGEAHFAAERFPEAAEALSGLLAEHPEGTYAPNAVYTLGWTYLKQEQHAAAQAQFAHFVSTWPDHELAPECRLRNGDMLHALAQYEAALAAYRPLVDGAGALRPEALLATAWVLFDAGRIEESAGAFARAASVEGAEAIAPQSLFNAGNAWLKLERYEPALEHFVALIERFPAHDLADRARYWRAHALLRLGRHAAALEQFAALAGDAGAAPERRPDVLFGQAEASGALARHREAADLYDRLVEQFPEHELAARAAYAAALERERAGDVPGAADTLRRMLAAYPDSELGPVARFGLAEYQFRLNAFADALATLAQVDAEALPEATRPDVDYKRGWAAFEAGQPALARGAFESLVARYPESTLAAEAAYMLGRCAEVQGDAAAAATAYRSCAERYPDSVFAVRSRLAAAQLAITAGQHAAALVELDALPGDAIPAALRGYAFLYRGEALMGLDRFAEARAAYLAVGPDEAPLHARAVYGGAWAAYRDGRFAEAHQRFSEAARLPDTGFAADAEFWAARALDAAGEPTAAAAAYAAFAGAHGASAWAPEARYREGICLAQAGDQAAALQRFAAVADGASVFAGNARYDLAWIHLEAGRSGEAEAAFATLLERHPESELVPDVRFRLASLAVDAVRYADALEQLDILAGTEGLAYADSVLYKRGWCLQELGRVEAAAETFAALAAAYPEGPLAAEARYRSGRALRQLGREREAVAALVSVSDGPFAARAVFQAAEAERALGNTAQALALYSDGLARFPEDALAVPLRLGLGHCQLEAGAYADALESYAAVSAATDTIEAAQAHLGSGRARLAMNEHRAAAREFLKVEILYGYDELKPEALAMLAHCYDALGDAERADRYRQELNTRYPDADPNLDGGVSQ